MLNMLNFNKKRIQEIAGAFGIELTDEDASRWAALAASIGLAAAIRQLLIALGVIEGSDD